MHLLHRIQLARTPVVRTSFTAPVALSRTCMLRVLNSLLSTHCKNIIQFGLGLQHYCFLEKTLFPMPYKLQVTDRVLAGAVTQSMVYRHAKSCTCPFAEYGTVSGVATS